MYISEFSNFEAIL